MSCWRNKLKLMRKVIIIIQVFRISREVFLCIMRFEAVISTISNCICFVQLGKCNVELLYNKFITHYHRHNLFVKFLEIQLTLRKKEVCSTNLIAQPRGWSLLKVGGGGINNMISLSPPQLQLDWLSWLSKMRRH